MEQALRQCTGSSKLLWRVSMLNTASEGGKGVEQWLAPKSTEYLNIAYELVINLTKYFNILIRLDLSYL